MFWRKKTPAPQEVKPSITLEVYLQDGYRLSWKYTGDSKIPFRDFQKWYFGRDSEFYVMRHFDGEEMFKREDIKRFTIVKRNARIEG